MTAMQEAFARVGVMARQAERGRKTLVLTGAPHATAISPRRPQIMDRLLEERAAYAAMSDDDLAFEQVALAENLEACRIELKLASEGVVEREAGWRPKAERATAMIKGRMKLAALELEKRRRAAKEQRRPLEEQQRAARAEAAAGIVRATEAKTARVALHEERERGLDRRFIRHAQQMLPEATYLAIWAAVNAGAPLP